MQVFLRRTVPNNSVLSSVLRLALYSYRGFAEYFGTTQGIVMIPMRSLRLTVNRSCQGHSSLSLILWGPGQVTRSASDQHRVRRKRLCRVDSAAIVQAFGTVGLAHASVARVGPHPCCRWHKLGRPLEVDVKPSKSFESHSWSAACICLPLPPSPCPPPSRVAQPPSADEPPLQTSFLVPTVQARGDHRSLSSRFGLVEGGLAASHHRQLTSSFTRRKPCQPPVHSNS